MKVLVCDLQLYHVYTKRRHAQGNLMQIGETEIACSNMWQRASKLALSDYTCND